MKEIRYNWDSTEFNSVDDKTKKEEAIKTILEILREESIRNVSIEVWK